MNAEILQKVHRIAADVLQVDPASLTAASSPETVENWDSVQHLNLVLAVEEQFGITFEPDEMDAMKTIGDIAALVAARNAART